jgi:hypothetical protein
MGIIALVAMAAKYVMLDNAAVLSDATVACT